MSLRICSLASGSSGNAYVVMTDSTLLLVDAGLSGKQIKERLLFLGRDAENIDGILVTHEHSDHIKGLAVLLKLKRPVFATRETLASSIKRDYDFANEICPGQKFCIGDIEINPFKTSHDAANPIGFSFSKGGKCISIITDTGYVTDDAKRFIKKSDILVLESNHDENVLKMGPYPWFLKQRILSDIGHLSNDAAGEALAQIVASENSEKKRTVLLAHLSKENNFPEMALATIKNILLEKGCKPNACDIHVLSRSEVSEIYE